MPEEPGASNRKKIKMNHSSRPRFFPIIAAGVSIAVVFAFSFSGQAMAAQVTEPETPAASMDVWADMGLQFQRFSKSVFMVEQGQPDGYAQLRDSRDRFSAGLKVLANQGRKGNCLLPFLSPTSWASLNPLADRWKNFENAGETMLASEPVMRKIRAAVKDINESESTLTELSQQLVVLKGANRAPPREILAANQLVFVQSRFVTNANRLLFDAPNPETAFLLGKDANTFADIVDGLLNGSAHLHLSAAKGEEKEKLLQIQKAFETDRNAFAIIRTNL